MQEKSISGLFRSMYNPKSYSIQTAQQFLNDYGGILCLLNDLKTSHREGIPSYQQADHEFRANTYGRNQLPPGESLLKKSISQERDFMVNLLFYLLTLRVCTKLLLVRDQFFGLEPIPTNFELSLYDELISYVLLFIMIFLKARVNIEYFNMDQDERKYKNEIIKVKRDGEIQEIQEKNLLIGDILVTHREQIIRVDGIILSCRKFLVSEAQTILRNDSKIKHTIWDENPENDPFILAGSSVVSGQAQILVCTVGENCSFRIDKQFMSTFFESPPLISSFKSIINYIENIAKVICVLLPTWHIVIYLLEKSADENLAITWIDFLYILKVYCSFIGLICLLQRLKILKSVNFFLQAHRSGKFFRIKNKCTFEKFSSLHILFIQWSAIAVRKREERDQILYELDHLSEISEINNYFNVKIITEEKKEKMKKIFGDDISDKAFFQPNQSLPHSQYLDMLMNATFITQSSIQDFITKYLPIYKALKCEIGYVSNSLNSGNQQIPEDVLHIGFHRLEYTQNFKPIIQNNIAPGYWIKLQNKIVMQDVLYEIIQESFVYANLFNTYFSLFVNNLFVFIILCCYSFFKQPINLYYSLAIIIVNRYLFFTVYRRIALETREPTQKKISFFEILKLNILLLPYYIYVASNLNFLSNVFIFFLVNSMLRIQTLLFKVQPSKSIKHLLKYTALIIFINLMNVLIWFDNKNWFNQQLKNLGYTIGLIFLFFIFAPLT